MIEDGRVVKGAAGMAGELGHVFIPMEGLLGEGQPIPRCNCGFSGDVESVASLTGIANNLLPYWLTRFPEHELTKAESMRKAAKLVRGYGEVRRRLSGAFTRFLDEILAPAVARDRSEGKGYARARAIVSETRKKLLADEKGIESALLEASRA